MPNPATSSTALALALEAALNKALRYDPASAQKLRQLGGKRLSIQAHSPDFELTLALHDSDQKLVTVSPLVDTSAECLLAGEFKGFIELLSGPKTSLAGSKLTLKGETGFLMSLLEIARQLDIDWEDALAEHLGQSVGHNIAELIRYKAGLLQKTSSRAPEYIRDFLTEELRALPSPFELEDFYDEVDDLHEAAERLAARLNALLAKTQAHTE